MDVKRIKWRLRKELDRELNSDHVLSVKREPILPTRAQDRTEWLLWACYKWDKSMEEANQLYLKNIIKMEEMVADINRRRRLKFKNKSNLNY